MKECVYMGNQLLDGEAVQNLSFVTLDREQTARPIDQLVYVGPNQYEKAVKETLHKYGQVDWRRLLRMYIYEIGDKKSRLCEESTQNWHLLFTVRGDGHSVVYALSVISEPVSTRHSLEITFRLCSRFSCYSIEASDALYVNNRIQKAIVLRNMASKEAVLEVVQEQRKGRHALHSTGILKVHFTKQMLVGHVDY